MAEWGPDEPSKPTTAELMRFFLLIALIVTIFGSSVFYVWIATHNLVATVVAAVTGVVLTRLLIGPAAVLLDRLRRGRYGASQLKRLRSPNASERLDAVARLRWLGQDATKAVHSIKRLHLDERAIPSFQRELDKYVLPGLTVAIRDRDSRVRIAAASALRELDSWQALDILERAKIGL